MKPATALIGGTAAATAVTLLHQLMKFNIEDAPHMDELGMESLAKGLTYTNQPLPDNDTLYYTTLAGDLLVNSAYYAAVGIGEKESVWLRGALLGLAAGVGGVVLPKPLGLNEKKSTRTVKTTILTVALYTLGGLISSAIMSAVEGEE